jgi:phage terminase large subunit
MPASATFSGFLFSADEAYKESFAARFDLASSSFVGYTDGYSPNPKQQLLHASTARHLLYGGAAGGGKSRGFREDIRRFCLSPEAAGLNVLLLRRTFPELNKNHWRPARQEWRDSGCVFNQSEHTVTWPNGCVLFMGHCQHEKDVDSHLGQEYARIYWDELTTFHEYMYDMISARARTTRPGLIPRIIAGTNPGGIGHSWVKARWIDRKSVDDEGRERDLSKYEFIAAKLSDNPVVDTPEYRELLSALGPAKRKAYLEGLWDIFEGQYFPEWSPDLHVCEPFAVPAHWPRWTATDWGGASPWCTLWFARNPDTGVVYVYREYYKAGERTKANAARVVDLSRGESFKAHMADPSMWDDTRGDLGSSMAGQCAEAGLRLERAYNPRQPGWQVVHEMLSPDHGGPRVVVLSTCFNLIRTLPGLVFDAHNVEDLDTDGEDHAADAMRYGLCEIAGKRRIDKPVRGAKSSATLAGSAYG